MKDKRAGEARAPRPRPGVAARQIDAFAGRDVRGVARQLELELFDVPTRTPDLTEEEPDEGQRL